MLPAFGVGKDAAGPIGLMVAVLLGGMAALLAGWSMLARDADDGRLGFLFAKPVSWPAIWAGKWIAAGLLAGASGLLAAIPWMAVYPPETKTSWWRAMADPEGWTYAVSLVVLIVGFANFAATAFRARSKWLAVDLTLLLAALWAVRRFVAPLAMVGVLDLPPAAGASRCCPPRVAVALLAASAGQLAVGRTDIVRAHRALSIVFWALVVSLLVAAAGRLAWVERAGPSDLRPAPYEVRPAPDGRWVVLSSATPAAAAGMPPTSWSTPRAAAISERTISADAWHRGSGASVSRPMAASRSRGRKPTPRRGWRSSTSRPLPCRSRTSRSNRAHLPTS